MDRIGWNRQTLSLVCINVDLRVTSSKSLITFKQQNFKNCLRKDFQPQYFQQNVQSTDRSLAEWHRCLAAAYLRNKKKNYI